MRCHSKSVLVVSPGLLFRVKWTRPSKPTRAATAKAVPENRGATSSGFAYAIAEAEFVRVKVPRL